MRVLFILTRTNVLGGAQIHVRDMAAALARSGHQVTVAAGTRGRADAQLIAQGTAFIPLKWLARPVQPLKDILAIAEIKRVLQVVQPDIVSLHSSKAGLVGRVACHWSGVPCIFTAHGWAFTDGVGATKRRVYRALERWAISLSDRVITVSEYDKQLAVNLGVATAADLVLVRNGVPDVPSALSHRLREAPVRLVMVARFSPPKDQELLINALAPLRECEWQLDLVGEGESYARCKALVRALDLEAHIRFAGEVDNVVAHLSESDIFVLVTNWEGLPRSIIEAMRAGLPVVASDVGGVDELVRDGENGYLVPRGDPGMLRWRLSALINDHALRMRMGLESRRHYEASFRFERMFKETMTVYSDVLAKCSKRTVSAR